MDMTAEGWLSCFFNRDGLFDQELYCCHGVKNKAVINLLHFQMKSERESAMISEMLLEKLLKFEFY